MTEIIIQPAQTQKYSGMEEEAHHSIVIESSRLLGSAYGNLSNKKRVRYSQVPATEADHTVPADHHATVSSP